MRMTWRTIALGLGVGLWPVVGCHQIPGDKSVQELRPIQQTDAKKQNLTAAEITHTAWMVNVETLEKAGKLAEAIALCEKMRDPGNPNAAQATKKIALLAHRHGDLDRAEQEYKLLNQQNPNDADVLTKLGDIAYARNQWWAAGKYYGDAVRMQESHSSAWAGLGMTLAQQGDYDGSWKAFKRVVSDAEAYCEIAFVLQQQRKSREAITAYEAALKLEPTMPRATAELAKLRQSNATPAPLGQKAFVEPEPRNLPASAIEGSSRTATQRPTLPPLATMPEYDRVPDFDDK
jgi:tetratricopeptide (TPR) repeat protein